MRTFWLERDVPMSDVYLAKLGETMRGLSENLGVSAEIVVVAGHELPWHSKTDYPDPKVAIRARVGFRRSLQDLDVLSKLYLSRLDWEDVAAQVFTGGFLRNPAPAGAHEAILAAEVRDQLDRVRGEVFAADLQGNRMGIRRFATVIQELDGKFPHLLALAEPAKKACAPIGTYQDALLKARTELFERAYRESAASRLLPKHHAMPMRGG